MKVNCEMKVLTACADQCSVRATGVTGLWQHTWSHRGLLWGTNCHCGHIMWWPGSHRRGNTAPGPLFCPLLVSWLPLTVISPAPGTGSGPAAGAGQRKSQFLGTWSEQLIRERGETITIHIITQSEDTRTQGGGWPVPTPGPGHERQTQVRSGYSIRCRQCLQNVLSERGKPGPVCQWKYQK